MKKLFKVLARIAAVCAAIYAGLFAIFFFDLDGKFIFKFVEPFLVRHYDNMERRNPLEQPYAQTEKETL